MINELGAGFLESVYQNAMAMALRERGLNFLCQEPVEVLFRNRSVGKFYADLLVESQVIVELKAVKAIAPEHQAQTINYLRATGIDVGLIINFGNPKLQYRRLIRTK